ncbi:MAG: hypothetical protein GXN93_05010 [Candidatus Diapherotrites archaeon]|nr:hypothetical protein [Candidatus Diapherotrites archaeon]
MMADIGQMLRAWWSIVSSTYDIHIPPIIVNVAEYAGLAAVGYMAGQYVSEAVVRAKLKQHHSELPEESRAGIRLVFGGLSAALTSAGYILGPYGSAGGFLIGSVALPYVLVNGPTRKDSKQTLMEKTTNTQKIPQRKPDISLDDLAKEMETPVAPKREQNVATIPKPNTPKKEKMEQTTHVASKDIPQTPKKTHTNPFTGILARFHKKTETPQDKAEHKQTQIAPMPEPEAPKPQVQKPEQAETEHKPAHEKHRGHRVTPTKKPAGTPKKNSRSVFSIIASLVGKVPKSKKSEGEKGGKKRPEKPKIVVEELGPQAQRKELEPKRHIKIPLQKHVKIEEIKIPEGKHPEKDTVEKTKPKSTAGHVQKREAKAAAPSKQGPPTPQVDPEVQEFRDVLKKMEQKYILKAGTASWRSAKVAMPAAILETEVKQVIAKKNMETKTNTEQKATTSESEPKEQIISPEKHSKAATVQNVTVEKPAGRKIRQRDVERTVRKILDELKESAKKEILARSNKKIHTWREVRAAKEAAEKIAKTAEPIIRQRIMETGRTDIDPHQMAAQILAEIQGGTAPAEPAEAEEPPEQEPKTVETKGVMRREDIAKIAEEVFEQVKTAMGENEGSGTGMEENDKKDQEQKHHRRGHRHSKELEEKAEEKGKKEKKKKKKSGDEDILSLLGGDEAGQSDSGDDIADLLGGGDDDLGDLDLGSSDVDDEDLGDLGALLK